MYTSGSTGRPKGVLIDHGGLADYLCWAECRYVRGDRLTYALFTSLAFDLTVTSLFLPLITGGTLEIYPESDGPVDSALMDVAHANAVDFIKLTPSHLSVLRRIGLDAVAHPSHGCRRRGSQDLARSRHQRAAARRGRDPQRVRPHRSCGRMRRASLRQSRGRWRQRADRRAGGSRPRRHPEPCPGGGPRGCGRASSGCRASGSLAVITGCRR